MKNVPNASYMSQRAGAELLKNGNGYFVHRDGVLLGIGMAAGKKIDWVASVHPGAGAEVVRALCNALSDASVVLEVASANRKAIDLYESLGFVATEELSRWYCIYEKLSRKNA